MSRLAGLQSHQVVSGKIPKHEKSRNAERMAHK